MFLSILKDSYLNFARKIIKVLKNKLLNEKKWFFVPYLVRMFFLTI